MKGIFRSVIFVDNDVTDVVTLDSEWEIDVQVGIAKDDLEMLNSAFE